MSNATHNMSRPDPLRDSREERQAYDEFSSTFIGLVEDHFDMSFCRTSLVRSCILLDTQWVEPVGSTQDALDHGTTWGMSLRLKFAITEADEAPVERDYMIGPIPKLSPDGTYIFGGLEWAPDVDQNERVPAAQSLGDELNDALTQASKNLRFWLPRVETGRGNTAPSIECLMDNYFRGEATLNGYNAATAHRWINVRLKNRIRSLGWLPRSWSKGQAKALTAEAAFCTIDSNFAQGLRHQAVLRMDFRRRGTAFSRAIPGVSEDELRHLDHRGLPAVGTQLRTGDILVGRLSDDGDDTSVRVGISEAKDTVWTVLDASLNQREDTARITMRWTQALEVGDVLIDGHGRRVGVSRITPLSGFDVLWPETTGQVSLSVVSSARNGMNAISESLTSVYPSGPLHPDGQRRNPLPDGFVQSIFDNGCPWTAWELLNLKSDGGFGASTALDMRHSARATLMAGEYPKAPMDIGQIEQPEGVLSGMSYLNALGLKVSFDRIEGGGLKASLGLMTDEEALEASDGPFEIQTGVGQQRRAPTSRKNPAHRDRLGKLLGRLSAPNESLSGSAHIDVQRPVLRPFIWEDLGAMLGHHVDDLKALIDGQLYLGKERPGAACRALLPYSHKTIQETPWDRRQTGIEALVSLMNEVDPTGTLKRLSFMNRLLVPSAPLKRDSLSKLTNKYHSIEMRNQRLKQLEERSASESTLRREALQSSFDDLCSNAEEPSLCQAIQAQFSAKALLCKDTAFSARLLPVPDATLPEGICVVPADVARVLFAPGTFGLIKTRMPNAYVQDIRDLLQEDGACAGEAMKVVAENWPIMLVSETQGVWTACTIMIGEGAALRVHPSLAKAFGAEPVQLHMPLLRTAVEEVKAHLGRIAIFDKTPCQNQGWLTGIIADGDVSAAVARSAFLRAEATTCEENISNPLLLMALGRTPGSKRAGGGLSRNRGQHAMNWAAPLTDDFWQGMSAPIDPDPLSNPLLDRPLDDFEWSARLSAGFRHLELETVAELVMMTKGELLRSKNMGRKSLKVITNFLASHGLRLGMKLSRA